MAIIPRLLHAKNRLLFERNVKAIRRTPPALTSGGEVTVLSMVQHRDVDAYLLAIKSFLQYVEAGRVVLVADPTLTQQDRKMIQAHVAGIVFREAIDARRPGVPQGGCWERLMTIADEVGRAYVVQLDADTVTVGSIDEVRSSIASGRAFLLPGEGGVQIVDRDTAAKLAQDALGRSNHIQVLAESKLEALAGASWRYARACAGFSGYPQASFNHGTVLTVCESMEREVGSRWHEWGSEQFTSNLIAASQPNAIVLPHPKYCNADAATPETAFLHFIGYARFTSGRYAQAAASVITSLHGAASN